MAVETCGDINALPEDCIANALSLTSPKDACRLSTVASTFQSAAQSDTVWERFLPSDYREIVSRSTDGAKSLIERFQSKKDLYLHLCDHPILIDSGRKSFSLEKCSGKKCYMLAARDLYIVWSDTPQYWQWISLPESRFPEAAELLDVCWLEIRGKINTKSLSPGTNYAAYLVFNVKSRIHGFHQETESFVGIVGNDMEKHNVCLDPEGAQRQRRQIVARHSGSFLHRLTRVIRDEENNVMSNTIEYPKKRSDGWMEVELGEYFVKGGGEEEEEELEMSLLEVKGGNWKSGIVIQGIEIRPKNVE